MYADHSIPHAAGQIIIAVYFIWMGLKNIKLWDVNVNRIKAQGLPAVPVFSWGSRSSSAGRCYSSPTGTRPSALFF